MELITFIVALLLIWAPLVAVTAMTLYLMALEMKLNLRGYSQAPLLEIASEALV